MSTKTNGKEEPGKRCFMICPIGDEGSAERLWSDDVYSNIVEPIAKQYGYKVFRAIDNDRPGDITQKIIGDISTADLIVADLTGHNPNVFYELALAHAWGRPCILMMRAPVNVPFDINNLNTIGLNLTSAGGVDAARKAVEQHFKNVGEGKHADNPVGHYETRQKLNQSGDPRDQVIANLSDQVQQLASDLHSLKMSIIPGFLRPPPPVGILGAIPQAGRGTLLTSSDSNGSVTNTALPMGGLLGGSAAFGIGDTKREP